jgi:archaellum component FlaG (FlaF/FlaG flagellin family)
MPVQVSWEDYLEFKASNRDFEGIEALSRAQSVISEPGNPPQRYNMAHVSLVLYLEIVLKNSHGKEV